MSLPLDSYAFWNTDTYKEGYSFEDIRKGAAKDQKALELAYKIMARKLPGWWQ